MKFTHRRTLAAVSALFLSAAGLALLVDAPAAHAARVDATCTNTTTDAATIQGKINASNPGDEIVIKGPCLINATISLLDDRTYRGDARSTTLTQAAGANLKAMLATSTWVNDQNWVDSNIRVERLTLDGNRAANTGTVGLMWRAWNSRIYDLEIRNTPSDGIRVSNPSRNGTPLAATSHMVNTTVSDVFIEETGGAGFHVVDPGNQISDWVLQRGWISTTADSAVDLDNAAGWTVADLHTYGTGRHAINANRCYGTTIRDNYLEDFGQQGTSGVTYYGIRCTVQDEATSTITGNKVHQLGGTPAAGAYVSIALDGVNSGTGRVAVANNAIVGHSTTRETGLLYRLGGGTALIVTSTGNLVSAVGTARTVSGATVTAGQ